MPEVSTFGATVPEPPPTAKKDTPKTAAALDLQVDLLSLAKTPEVASAAAAPSAAPPAVETSFDDLGGGSGLAPLMAPVGDPLRPPSAPPAPSPRTSLSPDLQMRMKSTLATPPQGTVAVLSAAGGEAAVAAAEAALRDEQDGLAVIRRQRDAAESLSHELRGRLTSVSAQREQCVRERAAAATQLAALRGQCEEHAAQLQVQQTELAAQTKAVAQLGAEVGASEERMVSQLQQMQGVNARLRAARDELSELKRAQASRLKEMHMSHRAAAPERLELAQATGGDRLTAARAREPAGHSGGQRGFGGGGAFERGGGGGAACGGGCGEGGARRALSGGRHRERRRLAGGRPRRAARTQCYEEDARHGGLRLRGGAADAEAGGASGAAEIGRARLGPLPCPRRLVGYARREDNPFGDETFRDEAFGDDDGFGGAAFDGAADASPPEGGAAPVTDGGGFGFSDDSFGGGFGDDDGFGEAFEASPPEAEEEAEAAEAAGVGVCELGVREEGFTFELVRRRERRRRARGDGGV